MDVTERDKLVESINYAKEKLRQGLISGEDASQLRRMIGYYQDKIDQFDSEVANEANN